MKHLMKPGTFKYAFMICLLTLTKAIAWAQDSTVKATTSSSSSSTTTEETWYGQPWVWIVGGAVLILLIVILTRGNSGGSGTGTKDQVTVTKTHTNEDV